MHSGIWLRLGLCCVEGWIMRDLGGAVDVGFDYENMMIIISIMG